MPSSRLDNAFLPTSGRMWLGAAAVLTVLFGAHVFFQVNPCLIYQKQFPVFRTTTEFFTKTVSQPGGPSEYVSALAAQAYYWRVPGAIVLAAYALLTAASAWAMLRAMSGLRLHPLAAFVPLVPLLILVGSYSYFHETNLKAPAAALLFVLYSRTGAWPAWLRGVMMVVVLPAVYTLTGGAVVLFAVLCGLYELLRKRNFILGPLWLVLSPVLPWAWASWSFKTDIKLAFLPLPPVPEPGVSLSPLAWLQTGHVALFVALAVWGALLGRMCRNRMAEGANSAPAASPIWALARIVALVVLGTWLAGAWLDRAGRAVIEVDYYVRLERWQDALAAAKRVPPRAYDPFVVHNVNRALYKSGRLPSGMCDYIQYMSSPSVALNEEKLPPMYYVKFSRFAFDIGQVNFAQHYGNLALETGVCEPEMLKLQVWVNIVKQRPGAARAFLLQLCTYPPYRSWANGMLERLKEDPYFTLDADVQGMRSRMLTLDYGYGGFGGFSYADTITQCLKSNPHNRMAFEYLMALFLLSRNQGMAAHNIKHLRDFNYAAIPPLWEEAVVVYQNSGRATPVDMDGRRVSEETVRRYGEFLKDYRLFRDAKGAPRQVALDALIRKWGNTYFFYAAFGFSEPRPGWSAAHAGPEKGQEP